MLLVQINPALAAPIEAEWRAHFADKFVRLRRTPSRGVRCVCDVLLDEDQPWGLDFVLRLSRAETTAEERQAFFRAADKVYRSGVRDVMPVNDLRFFLRRQFEDTDDVALRTQIAEEFAALGDVTLPKAAATRRVLFPLLKSRFGTSISSGGNGEYAMDLPGGAIPLRLWLDFGGFTRGLRWEVSVAQRYLPRNLHSVGSSYEQLLGIVVGDWDLLRTDRIEEDATLLMERIDAASRVLCAVPWHEAGSAASSGGETPSAP